MGENYRTKSPNYSQRNNPTSPERACNVSAVCSALRAAGYQLPPGETDQDDENFMRYIRKSKECNLLCEKLNRDWKLTNGNQVPPEQCHDVLDFAANQWLGKRVSVTIRKTSAKMMMLHMDDGGTCFGSGKFPTTSGHFVAFVDYIQQSSTAFPDYWIIKDPWGDYRTGYQSYYGNNVEMSYDDYILFMRNAKEELKLMHFVARTV